LGGLGAFCFNELATPRYSSEIALFTWNRSIANAVKKISKTKSDSKDKSPSEVMRYNSLISQSLIVGQRLISDYIMIINNPQVKKATNEDLIKKGFKPPLKYSFNCSLKRNSCVLKVSVISSNPKLAAAAANSLVDAFKKEQERLMDLEYAEIMHPATIPYSPFYPNKKVNLIVGFILGFLIGIVVASLVDYLDMTIKAPEDLRNIGVLPLGIVPVYTEIDKLYIKNDDDKISRRDNSILDAVRIISTTINFLRVDNPPKILQFTSALPNSGKSTMVLLLSKILSAGNKRMLLIDCDLRKPKMYKNLGIKCDKGLVSYLTDKECETPKKHIISDFFPNVDFMLHGIIPPNPTELLSSKKFSDMIASLKEEYDYILLDSPPCSGMADAMVIGQNADAIILMTDFGKTRTNDVIRTLDQFDSLRSRIIGAVINKVKPKKHKDYYYLQDYYYGTEQDNSDEISSELQNA
jgi:capsular exopolysaccharide synthesis family protein